MPVFYDHRIGAGHNVALNSLVNIENITPTSDRPFYAPKAYGNYDPGVERTRTDGLAFFGGYPSITWSFDVMTRRQYEYLKDTYCSGGFSGLVTIYTRPGDLTYARYNAVIRIPKPSETDGKFYAFKNIAIRFIKLEAL